MLGLMHTFRFLGSLLSVHDVLAFDDLSQQDSKGGLNLRCFSFTGMLESRSHFFALLWSTLQGARSCVLLHTFSHRLNDNRATFQLLCFQSPNRMLHDSFINMNKNCSKLHSILCHFSVSCIVFQSPLFYPTLYDETLSWFIIELALRVRFLFSCSFYTYPAMKVSHLYTNEKDGSIQLRNTSLSPPVFDLGTVADSPSSFCCIPSAPPYFF